MLPVVLVAMFMAQFDLYVVNVALPVLQQHLKASDSTLQLVVGGYAFTYAAGLISGGRLGDLLGHRRMFIGGMTSFGIASLLCGCAQTPAELVAARLLQGLTAAAMVPQVLALITRAFPPAERAKALSWFGVTIGVGAVAGQVLGGVLLNIDLFGLGWRIIFLVNVPIALITVVLARRNLPARTPTTRTGIDFVGALAISASLALVLIPLIFGRSQGWPVWSWVALALSVPMMILSLKWERRLTDRGGDPLLHLDLFSERAFNWGLATSVALFAAFFSLMFALTLVLQDGLGLSPLNAGLTFAPLGMAFALASVTAKRFIARYGPRVITVGTLFVIAGSLSLVIVVQESGSSLSAARMIASMVLIGLGNGIAVPALVGSVLANIEPKRAGAASGVLTTAQQFSSAIGIAALGGVFFHELGTRTGHVAYGDALTWSTSFGLALVVAAALMSTQLKRAR
jgi:EmrB/QacA subfamily drug resistance transporter